MKSLYELTGDIKDFNTVLVNRAELEELQERNSVPKDDDYCEHCFRGNKED